MPEPAHVHFGGELDAASSAIWRERLADIGSRDLTLDLRDVTFVDSTFLNALFRLARDGRRITVVDCPPSVVRIMTVAGIAGITEVIPQRPDELGNDSGLNAAS